MGLFCAVNRLRRAAVNGNRVPRIAGVTRARVTRRRRREQSRGREGQLLIYPFKIDVRHAMMKMGDARAPPMPPLLFCLLECRMPRRRCSTAVVASYLPFLPAASLRRKGQYTPSPPRALARHEICVRPYPIILFSRGSGKSAARAPSLLSHFLLIFLHFPSKRERCGARDAFEGLRRRKRQ